MLLKHTLYILSDDKLEQLLTLRDVCPVDPVDVVISKEDLMDGLNKDEQQEFQDGFVHM